MHQDEIVALLATLTAAYPRQELAAETIEVYAYDLADLEHGLAVRAFERCRRRSRFFPTIAEIREAAAEIRLAAPEPMVAYGQVVATVTGRSQEPLHETVRQAKRLVGDAQTWREAPAWQLQRLFLEAYASLKRQAVLSLVAPLPELAEGFGGPIAALPAGVEVVVPVFADV